MEETVVRQLSFPSPDSPGKLVPERTEIKRPIYEFGQGTVIWSSARKKGAIQNPNGIEAIRIIDPRTNKPAKERGLSLWQTLDETELFFRYRWTLEKGYTFYTYARNAKRTGRVLTIKK